MKPNRALPPLYLGAILLWSALFCAASLLWPAVSAWSFIVISAACLVIAAVMNSARASTRGSFSDAPSPETTAGLYAAELNRQLREEEAEVSAAAIILDDPSARAGTSNKDPN